MPWAIVPMARVYRSQCPLCPWLLFRISFSVVPCSSLSIFLFYFLYHPHSLAKMTLIVKVSCALLAFSASTLASVISHQIPLQDTPRPQVPTPVSAAMHLITPAPALKTVADRVCPGMLIAGNNNANNDANSNANSNANPDANLDCCIGGVFAVGLPTTKWFYNYTMASIPSTVITPTTCVKAVPMTAADFDAQVTGVRVLEA